MKRFLVFFNLLVFLCLATLAGEWDYNRNIIDDGTFSALLGDDSLGTIHIHNVVTVYTDITISENIELRFSKGGIINVLEGAVLTVNGTVKPTEYKIFNCAYAENSKVILTKSNIIDPRWFGFSDDDTTGAVNMKALKLSSNAFGGNINAGTIKLPRGLFYIDNTEPFYLKYGLKIEGAGADYNSMGTHLYPLVSNPLFVIAGYLSHVEISALAIVYSNVLGNNVKSKAILLAYDEVNGFPSSIKLHDLEIVRPYAGIMDTSAAWNYVLENVKIQNPFYFGIAKNSSGTTVTLINCSINGGVGGFYFYGTTNLFMVGCSADNCDYPLALSNCYRININSFDAEYVTPKLYNCIDLNCVSGHFSGLNISPVRFYQDDVNTAVLYIHGICNVTFETLVISATSHANNSTSYKVHGNLIAGSHVRFLNSSSIKDPVVLSDGNGVVGAYYGFYDMIAFYDEDAVTVDTLKTRALNTSTITAIALPTDSTGLASGTLYNDGGIVKIK